MMSGRARSLDLSNVCSINVHTELGTSGSSREDTAVTPADILARLDNGHSRRAGRSTTACGRSSSAIVTSCGATRGRAITQSSWPGATASRAGRRVAGSRRRTRWSTGRSRRTP